MNGGIFTATARRFGGCQREEPGDAPAVYERNFLRLIKLFVAMLALSLAVGVGVTGVATASQSAQASATQTPETLRNQAKKLDKQANKLTRQAKKATKQAKKLTRKAKKFKRQAKKLNRKAKKASGKKKKRLRKQAKKKRKQAAKKQRQAKKKRKQAKKKRNKAKNKRKQAKNKRKQAAELENNPPATIRTTEYGIPRIVADNWRGLGYGYGYALAKQNICSMAQIYTTVRGERSKYFGPNGTWQLTGNGIPFTNLEADFAHKRVIEEGTIDDILKMDPPNGPKPATQEAVDGYVKGYNKYLAEVGVDNLSDTTCKGQPWVKPIDAQDVYLRFFELGTMAGLGVAVDGTANAVPPGTALSGASADVDTAGITPEDVAASLDSNKPDIGSNAVGLGSDTTSTGKGMLYGNPHFPWQGSERFFEAQLTIPGKINVSGGSLLGVPLVLIGHNENLAWSHTVSTARRFSLFQEKLVPGKPTSYYLDGKQTPMKETKVTVEVKQPDDSVKQESRTLYSTVHGPVTIALQKSTELEALLKWSPTTAYTIFDANANGLRFINQFFDFNRAQSVDEMVDTLKEDLGVPWVNTIAADSEGNALYADVGSMPNIDDARAAECNTGIAALTWPMAKVAVFPGWEAKCDLEHAPGTPAKGLLPPSKMPIQVRKDYTSNMNDSYWLSNPKAPLTGFPSIIGDEGTARSLRTRNGLTQIENRLDGTDGNPGNKYTPELLRGFIDNDRHYGGVLLIPELAADCQANPGNYTAGYGGDPSDIADACDVLADWDHTDRLDSHGAYLARQVIGKVLSAPGGVYTNPFNLSDPVHTPSGVNVANANVRKSIADSVTYMNSKSIPLNATWRDYQYVTKAGEKIPIPGGPGGQGMFNVITASRNADGDYDNVTHGSSFIQMASMDGTKCPDVKMILTYSQAATDESSPHFKDQTKLFSNSEWVTDRFCTDQQLASPDLEVKDLNGGADAVKSGW